MIVEFCYYRDKEYLDCGIEARGSVRNTMFYNEDKNTSPGWN